MMTLTQFFKALADESRLRILWLLYKHTELCVCDVMEALQITQSKASRHLTTMKHTGLVTVRREGAWSYYSIRTLENRLERTLLQSLLSGMSDCPAASEALRGLNVWLADKERVSFCDTKRNSDFSNKKKK